MMSLPCLSMRRLIVSVALATGALAVPAKQGALTAAVASNAHAFTVIPPAVQLQQLQDSARQDPSSVRFVSDALVPDDISHPMLADGNVKTASTGGCANPEIRYEWRDATEQQRQEFTSAIQCMVNKPSRSDLPATYTRGNDLAAIHQGLIYSVHGTGAFLHWHRYFVWLFKEELRNSCGYQGPMLWWDETKDAGHFGTASMFTADYFGDLPAGDFPVNVTNGKFANLPLSIGPGNMTTNRTLSRQLSEMDSARDTQNAVNTCLSWNDFANMTYCVEGGPHGAGHNSIGGIMGDVFSSAGDPIFFLHHAFVDHIFWSWQQIDPAARLMAVGGITDPACEQNCSMVTLDYQLTAFDFAQAHPIRDFADTMSDVPCYKYNY